MIAKDNDIAIIGMALRVPGASSPRAFWQNLREGRESVRELSADELLAAGVPRNVFLRPNYVKCAATLDGMEVFDAEFFGFSPKEAAIMDPQHRQFLEACWEAFEDAAHPPELFDGSIGLFAGCGMGSYFACNILTNPDLVSSTGLFLLRHTGNDKDFLTTRASYLFDLRGPSVNVQTACSTSLVATHLACQHLLSGECDMALAGGVTIELPHGHGYHHEQGEILSPDGHCRAFDHRSKGTVFGSGVGVVVLRRLAEAVADGDQVYAVIKGTAVNNDGTQKVGYLAPSVEGQAACIAEALAVAAIDAGSLRYVECHGTGTPVGDPIEVAALTQAFRHGTAAVHCCGIGSVKTNIGHLDTAAGVASLAKAALALRHREIPPSINFEKNNPLIEFDGSPFYVEAKLQPLERRQGVPLRAGVNSLGVGGTNAFAVLEEHCEPPPVEASGRPWRLLTLSGRNRAALDANSANLARHLRDHPDLDLGDVAWTLQKGRRAFQERRVLVARDREEAITLLETLDPKRVFSHSGKVDNSSIAFLFPGGGSQHPRMAFDLYHAEPAFARRIDAGMAILRARHGVDLQPLWSEDAEAVGSTAHALETPSQQLVAIFLVEEALARLLIDWGVKPSALLGHSVGENTAACVAGTMSFEDCLGLVALRGRLMDRVAGAMTAVPLPPTEAQPLLDELGLDLAVVNAPDLCVASGPVAGIHALETRLAERDIQAQRVKIGIAAHSRMLDPVLGEFRDYLRGMTLLPPKIPWVSNLTGTWITNEEATSAEYWVRHLRGTVRFVDCLTTLAREPNRVFLEVGPGKALSSLARAQPSTKAGQSIIPTMRHAEERVSDQAFLLTSIGRLWAAGGRLDSARLFDGERRRRVGLPTYAFQGQHYFIEPGVGSQKAGAAQPALIEKDLDESRWYWVPAWKAREAEQAAAGPRSWLFFLDDAGIGVSLADSLRKRGDRVVLVRSGDSYRRLADEEYVVAPEHGRTGYDALVRDLVRTGRVPDRIAHLALLSRRNTVRPGSSFFHRNQEQGFYNLLFLAQAWASEGLKRPLHICVATTGMQKVRSADLVCCPEQATVLGPAKVIPRELADVTVSCVDVEFGRLSSSHWNLHRLAGSLGTALQEFGGVVQDDARPSALALLEAELCAPSENVIAAHRGSRRFVQTLRSHTPPEECEIPLRHGGVVLISGGLGGVGLSIAKELVARRGARVALLSRSTLPDRSRWAQISHALGPDHQMSRAIRGVRELEELGAEVLIVQGDVTNIDTMRTAVQAVRSKFGGLHGVVHAAGVIRDALLATKVQADVEDVLAPKVYGTLVLDEVTKTDDLEMFVLFSSTSTATAAIGQVDYVAANSFLNSFAEARRQRGGAKVVSLNWGIWGESGMAARAAARMLDRNAAADLSPATHPFFDRIATDHKGVSTLEARWIAVDRWFLDEHRMADSEAVFPGSGYFELAAAALAEIGLSCPFEIQDLFFFRPLHVDDAGRDVRVRLIPSDAGYSFEVTIRVEIDPVASGSTSGNSSGWRRVAHAELNLREQPDYERLELRAAEAGLSPRLTPGSKQENHLRFGPRWNVVDRVLEGERRAVAFLRLADPFVADLESFGLHPAMIDLATGYAMHLIDGYTGDRLWVPVSYQSVCVRAPLTERVCSIATVREGSSETSGFAQFDITITDLQGNVLVAIEGFTMKRLDGALDLGAGRAVDTRDIQFDPTPDPDRALSEAELLFQHNLAQGFTAAEGMRAFSRAVGSNESQVYASTMNLAALIAQTDAAAMAGLRRPASASLGASFARPQLAANYVDPRDAVEATLVELWQELLGVEKVGVLDNFFDLGGHSLIAVRLFAKVRRAFAVEFPISVLFEAPTIEACAALIRAAMPAQDELIKAATPDNRPRYKHLVPMHPGEGRSGRPFFLVAGMFGNVLNLRHLAHQIGNERPFYGLQARGLYGGEEPHETFEEMARDYLSELRLVQPHGPYYLGGFSGGGIAALEMARQLNQQGEEVPLLVMLDTPLPRREALTRRDRMTMHWQNLLRRGAPYLAQCYRDRLAWQRGLRQRQLGIGQFAQGELHSAAIEAAFGRALERYQLHPYDGEIVLFRPPLRPTNILGPGRQIDAKRDFIFEDNGWTGFCARVHVTEVPGDHDSMVLEPNVRVLANRMREAIDAARLPVIGIRSLQAHDSGSVGVPKRVKAVGFGRNRDTAVGHHLSRAGGRDRAQAG